MPNVKPRFKRGDFVKEGSGLGLVFAIGPKTFDVVWIGGGTSRYRHGQKHVVLVPPDDVIAFERDHLTKEADDIREERRTGAGVRRGQIWPSH